VEVLKDYVLGDTIARYMRPGPGGPVGMMLFPAAMAGQLAEKSSAIDSLVQIKTVGDTYPGGSAGRSLRNGGTVATLTLESQLEDRTDAGVTVVTLLRTHQGCLVEHHLRWQSGEAALDSFAVLRNEGPDTVTLELLSSFSLTGLTPFAGDDAPGDLILHRLRSAWSGEGRLVSDHVEDLSLEPAWASWERCLASVRSDLGQCKGSSRRPSSRTAALASAGACRLPTRPRGRSS